MTRAVPILVAALLVLPACSTTKPSPPAPDPVTDPTIVAAVEEAVIEGTIEGEAAARTGRRIGMVAGVVAAVFGGPESESLEEAVDRYRDMRDAGEAIGAVIGGTRGVVDGAKRGYQLDLQFAELQQFDMLSVTRPFPNEIQVIFDNARAQEAVAAITGVLAGRDARDIDVIAAGDEGVPVRDSLIEYGVARELVRVRRDDEIEGTVVLVIRARY
jgi:hypothetical protein